MTLFKRAALSALVLISTAAYALKIDSDRANVHIDTQKVTYLSNQVGSAMYASYLFQLQMTSTMLGDRIIVLNSLGGDMETGQMIIDMMEAEKTMGIRQICIVNDSAASMAFNILTHCDVRLAVRNSLLLAHVVAIMYVDCIQQRCIPSRLHAIADELQHDDAPYRRDNSQAMLLTPKEYDSYAAKDYRWTVEELLKRHYLHGVIKLKN